MVNDLNFVYSFDKLWKMPIYLYGAGIYGKYVLYVLNDFGITVEGMIDSNSELWGKNLWEVNIYSLEECLNTASKKDIIVIITTLSHSNEVVTNLEDNHINCNNIYTLYGCFWSFYFNLNLLPIEKEIKEKYNKIFSALIYKKKYDVYSQQTKSAMNTILPILQMNSFDVPVIIYQPGKVGSNTLEATLKKYDIPILRSHGVLYPCEYEKTVFAKYFYDKLKSFQKVKVITLVREPIAKDIGHFFQKIHISGNDVGWLVKGIMEKDFQQSFLNYLSIITPFDFSEGKKHNYKNTIISHIDYIGGKNKNGAFWGWFEEELCNNLGIDILEYEFDVEKGYSIIQKNNIELLVIKLECLNKLEKVLAKFVGLSEIQLCNSNEAKFKSYYYTYKQFQKDVKLPKKYVDYYYKDNIYTRHFYSQAEINEFYDKWKSHIVE